MRNDFCVFILTHGRANNLKTLKTLQKQGYTGRWYCVIDNEDDTAAEYYKRYGDHVIQFDKLAISRTFDTADTSDNRKTIVYARNACFDIAKDVGCRYFLQLDDDYTRFEYKDKQGDRLVTYTVRNLDRLFEMMVDYLETSGALTIAFAQGGDFIGGAQSPALKKQLLRKAMNSFFCSTDRPFKFVGRINEDVNTYTTLGSRGKLILSVTNVSVVQTQTQANKGGMTDVYIDGGTYLKSFYTVMMCPSCTKISLMGDKHMRIHHNVEWEHCVPMVLNQRWRKDS